MGLINMNARLYDPILHRFLAPDDLILNPYSTQDYNRYAYVLNNPLKYIDPSGNAYGPDDDKKKKNDPPPPAKPIELPEVRIHETYIPGSGGGGGYSGCCGTGLGNNSSVEATPIPFVRTESYNSMVNSKTHNNANQGGPGPFQVGWEWLTGGTKHRNFTNGDYFTELLRKHSHIEATKNLIRNGSRKGRNPYSLGGLRGVGLYIKDYSTLLTAGATGNLAVTYLGSYELTYEVIKVSGSLATVLFTVENRSTIESALHPPVIGYLPGWSTYIGQPLNNFFSSGPLSQTTQTFIWTETIKLK
ncbi:hypothetical protein GCM10027049_03090 [Mucilaginibacter puniceus]